MKKTTKIYFNKSKERGEVETTVKIKEGNVVSIFENDSGPMGGSGYLYMLSWFGPETTRRTMLKAALQKVYNTHEYAEEKLARTITEDLD